MAKRNCTSTGIRQRKLARSPHQPTGTWCHPPTRLAVYCRDGFRCLLCLTPLTGYNPRDITLDHYVPVSQGGSNDPSNLYTACRSCNSSRQDAPGLKLKRLHTARSRSLAPFRELARRIMDGRTWNGALRAAARQIRGS